MRSHTLALSCKSCLLLRSLLQRFPAGTPTFDLRNGIASKRDASISIRRPRADLQDFRICASMASHLHPASSLQIKISKATVVQHAAQYCNRCSLKEPVSLQSQSKMNSKLHLSPKHINTCCKEYALEQIETANDCLASKLELRKESSPGKKRSLSRLHNMI